MKLRILEGKVYDVLVNKPETRSDDYLLIEAVISEFIGSTDLSFKNVWKQHSELGLPSLESITRCRRKIQSGHPELVDEVTAEFREEKIDEYIQYALNLGD